MTDDEMFTVDDAENDGLIKREVGKQMAANLKRSSPRMWQMFEEVCNEQEIRPEEKLGDHALRAVRKEDHSKMLADIRVDMSQVKSDQIRIQDAEFLQELSKSLGLDDESGRDPIDELIERRLKAKAGPMLPGADKRPGEDIDRDVKRELDTIKQRMVELQESVSGSDISDSGKEDQKDIDELFSGGEDDSGDGHVEEQEDVVEDQADVEDVEVVEEEDEADYDNFEEFLEGDDNVVDDQDVAFDNDEPDVDESDNNGDDTSGGMPIEPDGINTINGGDVELVDSSGGVEEDE